MKEEEKQLLLKDLSARLLYGVKFQGEDSNVYTLDAANYFALQVEDMIFKPYLRPMSSMTEKEKKNFNEFICIDEDAWLEKENGYVNQAKIMSDGVDWLNKKMFDYRGLIPMGLALEAPEGMYKTE